MDTLRWAAPAVLAVVMAAAAGAKLSRPADTRRSFEALGLRSPAALAGGVPVVELAVAVLLIAVPPIGAVLAVVVLVAFSAFLIGRLRRGDETPCACFGQVRPRPIDGRDLVRNIALLGLATTVLAWPPT